MAGFEAGRVHLPSIDVGDLFDLHLAGLLVGLVMRVGKPNKGLPSTVVEVGGRHMRTSLVYNTDLMCYDHSIAASGIQNALWRFSAFQLCARVEGEGIDTQTMPGLAGGSVYSRERPRRRRGAVVLKRDEQRRG
jgi:hypothetical protein